MASDPELVAETRAWFVKASNDIRYAEALSAVSPPLPGEGSLLALFSVFQKVSSAPRCTKVKF
jgi:hypothetical protein